MQRSLFITGTDTGVGKTLVARALVHAYQARGCTVAAMKPVASGAEHTPQGLRNDDALALQQAANVPIDYEWLNPYCFEPAIAPHIAANEAGVTIELPRLINAYRHLTERADVVIVEGAGGWRVPLPQGYLSDFPEALHLDVVLVVGVRLGCLNHALLTEEAIERGGHCRLVGWVANLIDPACARLDANLATLHERLHAPCCGILQYEAQPDAVRMSTLLKLERLLA